MWENYEAGLILLAFVLSKIFPKSIDTKLLKIVRVGTAVKSRWPYHLFDVLFSRGLSQNVAFRNNIVYDNQGECTETRTALRWAWIQSLPLTRVNQLQMKHRPFTRWNMVCEPSTLSSLALPWRKCTGSITWMIEREERILLWVLRDVETLVYREERWLEEL